MPYEPGPDDTLTPDEAHAWSVIERSLRRDLDLHRIERRARLRSDRPMLLAIAGVLAGAGLAAMASLAPAALTAIGMVLAGACLGVIFVRAMLTVVSSTPLPRHDVWTSRRPRRRRGRHFPG